MGLLNINNTHRAITVATAKYLTSSNKTNIKPLTKHEQEKSEKSIVRLANNFLQQNDIENSEIRLNKQITQLLK